MAKNHNKRTRITSKFLVGTMSLIIIFSCKNSKIKETNKQPIKDTMLTNILSRQLEDGPLSDYNDVKYGINDFEATISILKNELKRNGFIFVDKSIFAQKIKLFFDRPIDVNSAEKYLYVNYLNSCNKKIILQPNDHINIEGSLLLKNESFMTDMYFIPEILRYEEKYPELTYIEDKARFIYDGIEKEKIEIDRWKDLKDLADIREKNILTFLNRNKYLFNDNQGSLSWLIFNDNVFLKNLLILFGYDKEPRINKLVLNSFYDEKTLKNVVYGEAISNLFFIKDCQNTLKIRKGLLKYVEEHTSATDNRFIYALGSFMSTLYDGDEYKIFDEDPSKKFTAVEKAEIVANIANIENPAREKYKSPESSDVWNIPGSSLYNLSVSHPEVIKIIEQHHYFGLPKMKEIIAKLQDEAPPTPADPE